MSLFDSINFLVDDIHRGEQPTLGKNMLFAPYTTAESSICLVVSFAIIRFFNTLEEFSSFYYFLFMKKHFFDLMIILEAFVECQRRNSV